MNSLYVTQKRSQAELGALFGVQPQTVARWLDRLGIQRRNPADCVSTALSKHPFRSFDGSGKERSYLLGLRAGDLHAQKHGRRIRASVGTSHPGMEELFRKLFSRYGVVKRYPKFSRFSGYHWSVYSDLDYSFDFILSKLVIIPEWTLEDNDFFLSFLAGYFDAEGCISFDFHQGSHAIYLILKSCDHLILSEIVRRLPTLGFHPTFTLSVPAGKDGYRRDYWCLRVNRRSEVEKLLRLLDLRHPEKVEEARLAHRIMNGNPDGGKKDVIRFRTELRRDTLRYRKAAARKLAIVR